MKQLNKSEVSALNDRIKDDFGVAGFFGRKDKVVVLDVAGRDVLVKDGCPLFFYHGSVLVPTLKLLLEQSLLRKVTVDMGAVKFVANGADIMRPGITAVDDGIEKGALVVVIDETHKKPLAVCEALFSSDGLRAASSGKVLKNLHYVGDSLWTFFV